jgi:hypothetical protein
MKAGNTQIAWCLCHLVQSASKNLPSMTEAVSSGRVSLLLLLQDVHQLYKRPSQQRPHLEHFEKMLFTILIKKDNLSCFQQRITGNGTTRKHLDGFAHVHVDDILANELDGNANPTTGVPVETGLFDGLCMGRDLHGPGLCIVHRP